MITGRVARILNEDTVVLNVGTDHGVLRGMNFAIYTPYEEFSDPETGESLGAYRKAKAVVQAQSVHGRFTIAGPRVRTRSSIASLFPSGLIDVQTVRDPVRVDRSQIQPLPTGDDVRINDTAEELVSQGSQPALEAGSDTPPRAGAREGEANRPDIDHAPSSDDPEVE